MRNKTAIGIFVVGAIAITWFRFNANPAPAAFDPRNATYEIEGAEVTLIGGVAEVSAAPGSASKTVTRYFGNEAEGDLDRDGRKDRVFLLVQDGGGTGVFYYAVAALDKPDGYRVTNAVFVGDRIAPQSTEIREDISEARVNYADRLPGEPMSARPSLGVTFYLKIGPAGTLEKVAR